MTSSSEAVGHGTTSSSEAVGRSTTSEPLPLVRRAEPSLGTPVAACSVDDDGCITCGDVAVALTVVEVDGFDARCRDEQGREELVATELVDAVAIGDRLLVHARVALEKLHSADPVESPRSEEQPHALR